jgi:hypothetical protein
MNVRLCTMYFGFKDIHYKYSNDRENPCLLKNQFIF